MTQAERDRLVALKKAKKKLITQKEAAQELGITERHVRRLLRTEAARRQNRGARAAETSLPSQDQRRYGEGGGGDPVAAPVPGLWADAGSGIPNEAPPQTDEVYSVLAEIPGFLGGLGVLCVRSIWHPVGDARDAVFDQRDVEIDE